MPTPDDVTYGTFVSLQLRATQPVPSLLLCAIY